MQKNPVSGEKTQDLQIVSLSNGKGLEDAKRSRDSGMGATAHCVSLNLMIYLNPAAKLLSHFSRVRLCVTPETAAHQAPPSLGFSRQEHWSGLPFLSPLHESKKGK